MSDAEFKAAKTLGPTGSVQTGKSVKNGISVLIAGAASASTDISAAAELGADPTGKLVTLACAAGGAFYRWDAGSGGTVDEAATSGPNRCFYLPPGVPIREYPSGPFLVLKRNGSVDVPVRVAITSP